MACLLGLSEAVSLVLTIEEMVKKLGAIPGAVVREVLRPYDFVVDLEADTREDVTAILKNKIRPINGVTNAVTRICF